ncbi:MAG: hypothetical protein GXO23_05075, partial [Crenarchaeota archaeon]|nr:hypothetical protein [Thermoproteota archaeon]
PLPSQRYRAFVSLDWHWKNITLEPIMDFDLDIILNWIQNINPILIFLGYDSLKIGLPEPPLQKTTTLIRKLEQNHFTLYKNLREPVKSKIMK